MATSHMIASEMTIDRMAADGMIASQIMLLKWVLMGQSKA